MPVNRVWIKISSGAEDVALRRMILLRLLSFHRQLKTNYPRYSRDAAGVVYCYGPFYLSIHRRLLEAGVL
jgi:hypothetical protein